jgi:hypothetical protein
MDSVTKFSTLGFFVTFLIQRVKPFRIWLRIRQDILDNSFKCLASVVSMRPRKLQQSQLDRRSHFHGLIETKEALL